MGLIDFYLLTSEVAEQIWVHDATLQKVVLCLIVKISNIFSNVGYCLGENKTLNSLFDFAALF